MGKIVKKDQPCVGETCESSDGMQVYEKGDAYCFSCRKFFTAAQVGEGTEAMEDEFKKVDTTVSPNNIKVTRTGMLEEIKTYPVRGFVERKIKRIIAAHYGVHITYGQDGKIDTHYYPYKDGYKVRELPKKFSWLGKSGGIFGQELFQPGGKRLIICEGEIDTLAMAQANYDRYQKFYPVIGLSSSAAVDELLKERDWIRSFKEVIICFDEDEAGEKAKEKAIKIVGIDKAKLAKLPRNDACEVLIEDGAETLLHCIWDAAPYIPPGIIGKEELWESLVEYNNKPSMPYPACIGGLNDKLKGMRDGEIALFVSGTGSGKSTMMREIMMHILQTTDEKIGVVSLEESPAETARKLSGMQLNRNPAHEEISLEDLKPGFDKVFGDDRVILLNHGLELGDNSIMDKLEYMCLSGCKKLFIDHITILVSEGVNRHEGNEAQDRIMNEFVRLTKRHNVWIGLVSHLRKVSTGAKSFEEGEMPTLDDIRGSGSVKQISSDVIGFSRNLVANAEIERNTIRQCVLKSRFTGLTGFVKSSIYNHETGRLKQADVEFEYVSEYEKLEKD